MVLRLFLSGIIGASIGMGLHLWKREYDTRVDRTLGGMVISNGGNLSVLDVKNKEGLNEFAERLDGRESFKEGDMYLESMNNRLYVSVPRSVNSYRINNRLKNELLRYSKGE